MSKHDIEQISTAVTERLLEVVPTKADLAAVKQDVAATKRDLADGLAAVEERLTEKFSDLQASVDRYMKRTEGWHDEFNVLKARYDRLVHVLDQKGIVREEEIHLA